MEMMSSGSNMFFLGCNYHFRGKGNIQDCSVLFPDGNDREVTSLIDVYRVYAYDK